MGSNAQLLFYLYYFILGQDQVHLNINVILSVKSH